MNTLKQSVISEISEGTLPSETSIAAESPSLNNIAPENSNDDDKIQSLLEIFKTLTIQIKNCTTLAKHIQKDIIQLNKSKNKKVKRVRGGDGTQVTNGFSKPVYISPEMCDFMGIANGELRARTEVTRCINTYVKQNDLSDKQDKRRIIPDSKLKSLIRYDESNPDFILTYFNLQCHIKHHFVPPVSTD